MDKIEMYITIFAATSGTALGLTILEYKTNKKINKLNTKIKELQKLINKE